MEQQILYRTVEVNGLSVFTEKRGPGMSRNLVTTRPSVIVADVSAATHTDCRSLPSDCSRLPGLRTQRLARPQTI